MTSSAVSNGAGPGLLVRSVTPVLLSPQFPRTSSYRIEKKKGENGNMNRYLILDDVYDAEVEILDNED